MTNNNDDIAEANNFDEEEIKTCFGEEDVDFDIEKTEEDVVEEGVEEINTVGRPKGIPASMSQKMAVSKAAKEYQRKLREGLIEKEIWETHGAYSFMKSGRINKKKRHLVKFVYEERQKWINDLGGEENLNSIEFSLIDEASRLLLFSCLINEHLLLNRKEDIIYKAEDGDIKLHSALSKNYLSFTKAYTMILKELQKNVRTKSPNGVGGKGDIASRIQNLYNKE